MEYTYGFSNPDYERARERGGVPLGLFACIMIFAAAVAAAWIFPEETAALTAKLGLAEKYGAAIETVSRLMTDEPSDDDAAVVTVSDVDEDVYDVVLTEPVAERELEALILPTDGMTCDEAAVAAFKETAERYKKYGVPAKATYDMPAVALNFICPLEGTVSSGFGYRPHPSDGVVRFHYGTDIAAPKGTDVAAFADGTVKAVGTSSSYGKYVMVEHEDSVVSMYAHCSKILAHEGDKVMKGDIIAAVGDTGNATGPCLHFEMIIDGKYVNPEYYISWT